MKCTFSIGDWTPPTLNGTSGKFGIFKRKKRLKEATDRLIVAKANWGLSDAETKRKVSIVLHGWKRGRLPDRDAFDKVFLDALVGAKLLKDDGPDWLEGRMEVQYVRSASKLTVITLEDVE